MFTKALLTLFALSSVLAVHAQSGTSAAIPTSTGSIPPCVLTCTAGAASQSGCSGVGDLQCVCTSQAFQNAARSCLQSTCSAADQQTANSLQSALCASIATGSGAASSSGGGSGSGSGSATATSGATASGTNAGTSSGTASESTTDSTATSAATGSSGPLPSSTAPSDASSSGAPNASTSSSAASALSFGLGATHVFGAIGVTVGMVIGLGALL